MIRIINKRATGKTSQLLLLAKESNGIIVSAYPNYVKELAVRYGIEGVEVISYSTFLSRAYKREAGRPILIDEIEQLLKTIDPHIYAYTISEEDENWRSV